MSIMTLEDVKDRIEIEGFDYAFRFYSKFEDVKDDEFHRLRRDYVQAAAALADYIEMNTEDGDDENEEVDDDNDQEED